LDVLEFSWGFLIVDDMGCVFYRKMNDFFGGIVKNPPRQELEEK
jgi:hypothetical protein